MKKKLKIENQELVFKKVVVRMVVAGISFEVVSNHDAEFDDYDFDISPMMNSDQDAWNKLDEEEKDEIRDFIISNYNK